MVITLRFDDFKLVDWLTLCELLAGKPPDGALIDAAPCTGYCAVTHIRQALEIARAAGEEAAPSLVEFELTPNPGEADAAFADFSQAWVWIATRTPGLRLYPAFAPACKLLESLGDQLSGAIAELGHDTAVVRAMLQGTPSPDFSVKARKESLRKLAMDLRRRAKQGMKDNQATA